MLPLPSFHIYILIGLFHVRLRTCAIYHILLCTGFRLEDGNWWSVSNFKFNSNSWRWFILFVLPWQSFHIYISISLLHVQLCTCAIYHVLLCTGFLLVDGADIQNWQVEDGTSHHVPPVSAFTSPRFGSCAKIFNFSISCIVFLTLYLYTQGLSFLFTNWFGMGRLLYFCVSFPDIWAR